uniref:Alpha-galactosidase n=1 Tax=Quercus lobata TaxID=97700 RepID=A0A7N2R8R3_QUELO
MTLWSMAKSPLMFGGDFPYITSTKNFKSIDGQSGRYLTDMWELSVNGTLANSYSGLCATVNSIKAEVRPGGTRSWIATGRKGEIYVAFINLNPERTVISAKISDMTKLWWSRSKLVHEGLDIIEGNVNASTLNS